LVPRDGCVITEQAYTLSVDVACGVHVPVETHAAGTALKDPITEGELGSRLATVSAHLRRGVEPVDRDHAMTSVVRLVGKLTT
jgi:hypothetical protein